ncbi:MerR family transcriptional regulator [Pendulispora albinea]|uniref:MerR family transcriptional regulator n=1 Tax=Pendulispora albinea TaxID=2741071 RepID=A0ABZ2M889_9BACT
MTEASAEYRIEDLAREAMTTVRNVRAYQDKGLLPRPRKRGRVAVYDETHLARLRLVGQLLERGYTLANIKELVQAWDGGQSLGAVLGLVAEAMGPADEAPGTVSLDELFRLFPEPDAITCLAAAIRLGIVEPEAGSDVPAMSGRLSGVGAADVQNIAKATLFRVPSPRLFAIGVELHAAGVPIRALLEQVELLREDMDRIARRFLELSTRHIFARYLGSDPGAIPKESSERIPEITDRVRRLRPLAQSTVNVELARAMRSHALRCVKDMLGRALVK